MSFKRSSANNITRLNPKELANCLRNNGYGDLSEVIIERNLAGQDLLNMSEMQARILRLDRTILKRLLQCMESLKYEPEKFTTNQNSERKHNPFQSGQNNAARAKIEKLFATPRQLSTQNFTLPPPLKSKQEGESDNADNDYLCMNKKNYRPDSPLYDDEGYLIPSGINAPIPNNQFKSLSDRQVTPDSNVEDEEEYENIPKVTKPKLPPRITKTTQWKGNESYVNHPQQASRKVGTPQSEVNGFKLPPIAPRSNTFDSQGKEHDKSGTTERKNRVISWMKDKQLTLGKINTKFAVDRINKSSREQTNNNNEAEEENIYEQEPSTPPQQKNKNLNVRRPTSLSLTNRPLPRIPPFGDQCDSSPTISTPKRTPDTLQLPDIRSLKGSKESIVTDSEDESVYKNDSVALENMRRNLLITKYKFNEDVPKPPPLTKKDNATAKIRNWKASNKSTNREDILQYGNLNVSENKENDNESSHSTTSSTLSLSNVSNSANSPSTGKYKRVDLEPADDNDEEYASAVFNLNDEPYYRNTDRRGAKELLDGLEDGAFLFRPTTRNYFLTLTVKWRKKFFNINIVKESNTIRCQSDSDINPPCFQSLSAFIRHFERNCLTLKYDNDISEVYLRSVLPANRF